MRNLLLLLGLVLGALAIGASADDLITLKGTTYRNFTVVKADNGFLAISYDEGTASLKAEVLPEAIREKYGLTDNSGADRVQKYFSQLVLKDNTSYFEVTVAKVDPDGLTIMHRDGGGKVPFEKLPDFICNMYGLTSDRALAYRATIKPEPLSVNASSPSVETSSDANTLPAPTYSSTPTTPGDGYVYVHGYYRKNGTYVNGYYRRK